MLVDCTTAKDQLSILSTTVCQESWNDVLDPIASISPSDTHQGLQVMGEESHHHRGNQSDCRKDNPVYQPRICPTFPVEEGLPVVPQRHSDDWEVGANGEDREKTQEVANEGNVDDVTVGEVERVHVHKGLIAEAVDSGEGQEAVETQN